MKKNARQLFLLSLSFLIVAFAQPDWSRLTCILASCMGYALFWRAALYSQKKKTRFWLATLWFALTSAIHLNWFLSDRYVGFYIYPFLVLLSLALGMQFGLLTLCIRQPKEMGILDVLGISGGWTLFEWLRLHVLSGFSWDPVGLELTATLSGMQMSSAFGIYGLSFWVILTNLFVLRLLSCRSLAHFWLAAGVAIVPYLFGFAQLSVHSSLMRLDPKPPLSALLVQTALLPEEKLSMNGSMALTPVMQWERILQLLYPYQNVPHDVIILPEGAVPYGTDVPLYPIECLYQVFKTFFQQTDFLPATKPRVSNREWAQALANATLRDVVIGLETSDENLNDKIFNAYNAAFLFRPFSHETPRYEKRILVPMGEYIPFKWCKKILSKYGILDSFTPGVSAKIFPMKRAAAGISICYEETYGECMRSNCQQGAELLINLTNDVWYPHSRLPLVHFLHGRLRAVECGLPLLRACNTGVTCGVNALGRVVDYLPFDCSKEKAVARALSVKLPLYHYQTFYALFGDAIVIYSSLFLFASFGIVLFLKKKKFILNDLNVYPLRKN